jgi:hypothetical protein
MPQSGSTRALIGAAIVLVVAACGSTAVATGAPAPKGQAPAATTDPTPAVSPTAPPSAAPTASTGPQTFDTREMGSPFDIPMTLVLPTGWMAFTPPDRAAPGTFSLIHGDPNGDQAQWWGPDVLPVDGASVLDPKYIDSTTAWQDKKLPLPASYIDYLAAMPGVTIVSAPRDLTIDGVAGRKIVMKVPPMHPTIHLKDDTAWIGGGPTGMNPGGEVEIFEFTVDAKRLLIVLGDDPAKFDGHAAELDPVIESIRFP